MSCYQGFDSNYDGTITMKETFHQKDCNELCWQGQHLIKMGIGLFILSFYIFTSIIGRPHW